eukprot:6199104-Pleurochrysis_carterae.AAC.3
MGVRVKCGKAVHRSCRELNDGNQGFDAQLTLTVKLPKLYVRSVLLCCDAWPTHVRASVRISVAGSQVSEKAVAAFFLNTCRYTSLEHDISTGIFIVLPRAGRDVQAALGVICLSGASVFWFRQLAYEYFTDKFAATLDPRSAPLKAGDQGGAILCRAYFLRSAQQRPAAAVLRLRGAWQPARHL